MSEVDWRESIEETGFAIQAEIFTRSVVDDLLRKIGDLAPRRSRAGVRHALSLKPVADIARGAQMMDLARRVLGRDAFPFRATVFDKSPTANWLVVWHQDTALPLRERANVPGWGPWSVKDGIDYAHAPAIALSQVLALRLSLDDSNGNNGPLRVLPRTHRHGVLTDDAIHDLSTRITAVDCLVPKGGIIAIRPLIVHASSKSTTDLSRRVLHVEYAASECTARPLRLAVV